MSAIKIFCCAFSDSFTLHDWSKVAQWVTSLSLRKLEVVHPGQPKPSMIERSGSVSSVLSSGSRSSSRHTSISGQNVFSLRNKVIVCVVDCTCILYTKLSIWEKVRQTIY